MSKLPRISLVSVIITAVLYIYIIFIFMDWRHTDMLAWDTTGYYMYLPGTFIYKDLGKADFFNKMTDKYHLNNGAHDYGMYPQPATGLKLNKYAIGTAVMELPAFFIAYWYCLITHQAEPDGYSEPYRHSVVLGGIFWVLAGLYYLRKFLLNYYNEKVVALIIVLLAFGTNLYFYTIYLAGMSHQFSFAIFSFLLYATDRWYATFRTKYAIAIGLCAGLILILRPTNIVVIIVPLLWLWAAGKTMKEQLAVFLQHKKDLVLALFFFFLMAMIQCSYWKYVTGHWIHYSYQEEGFTFSHPHIWDGLFSYKKGWFVYTPLAFFAMLGFIPLYRKNKRLAVLLTVYAATNIYIVFSWREWWYGGGFGARSLIEMLSIFAIPLGALIQWIFSLKKVVLNAATMLVFSFCIFLNLFQSYQLKLNVIDWDSINKSFYWRTFLKLDASPEDKELLRER